MSSSKPPLSFGPSSEAARKRYVAKVGINYRDLRVEPGETVPDAILDFGTAESDLLASGAIEVMD